MRILLALVLFSLVAAVAVAEEVPAQPNDKRSSFVASVLLKELPPNSSPGEALRRALPNLQMPDGKPLDAATIDDSPIAAILPLQNGRVIVSLMDVPVPKDELRSTCRAVTIWFEAACDVAEAHRAHMLVAVLLPDLEPVEAALLASKIVAALVDVVETQATAVYWGTALSETTDFRKQVRDASRESLPILNWVSFQVSRDASQRVSLSTSGMDAFGLLEVEVENSKREPGDVLDMILGMCTYLLIRGPVVNDGETVGRSDEEKFKVRQVPSAWDKDKRVYRVEM